MSFHSLNGLLLVLLTSLVSSNGFASEDHHHHAHHEHGKAKLSLVQEGNRLMIELQIPALDALGFEGLASNKQEQARSKQALKILSDAHELFTFTGTPCLLNSLKSNLDDQQDLSDIEVLYTFSCDKEEALMGFGTDLFDKFPSIQHVESQWITDHHHGVSTLNAQHSNVRFGEHP